MRRLFLILLLLVTQNIFALHSSRSIITDWGFFAHKLLNKLAVFTLPEGMIEFYKSHIDFIEEHAVDPDKRRYSIKGEAIRHYIDLDQWIDKDKHKSVPKNYQEAIIRYSKFYIIQKNDTTLLFDSIQGKEKFIHFSESFKTKFTSYKSEISVDSLRNWLYNYGMRYYDDINWNIPSEDFSKLLPNIFPANTNCWIDDQFSRHGIIPYSLPQFYFRLVNAFKSNDEFKILKLSSEIGHYVGDAHVPLHTTKNYNGQLTNQDGIHAFWESRIPELFADSEFDYVVGPAEYIDNISKFVWKTVETSHQYVDSVLSVEKRISHEVPNDQQYCYENRLGQTTKLPCKDYSALYNKLLDGQVEDQFRKCILAIGSVWMSAWIDAGQPDLSNLKKINNEKEFVKTDSISFISGKSWLRDHE